MKVYRLKEGATAHLKEKGYWCDYEGNSTIDGLAGYVSHEYMYFNEYPHVAFIPFNSKYGDEIGIAKEYLEEIDLNQPMKSLDDRDAVMSVETILCNLPFEGWSSRCVADKIIETLKNYLSGKEVKSKPWEAFAVGKKA